MGIQLAKELTPNASFMPIKRENVNIDSDIDTNMTSIPTFADNDTDMDCANVTDDVGSTHKQSEYADDVYDVKDVVDRVEDAAESIHWADSIDDGLSNPLYVKQRHLAHQYESSNTRYSDDGSSVEMADGDELSHMRAMFKFNGIEIKGIPEATEYLRYMCSCRPYTKTDGKYAYPKCMYTSSKIFCVKRHAVAHFKTKMFTCLKCKKEFRMIEECRKPLTYFHGVQMSRINFSSIKEESNDPDVREIWTRRVLKIISLIGVKLNSMA